jgi:hypothetical protein
MLSDDKGTSSVIGVNLSDMPHNTPSLKIGLFLADVLINRNNSTVKYTMCPTTMFMLSVDDLAGLAATASAALNYENRNTPTQPL